MCSFKTHISRIDVLITVSKRARFSNTFRIIRIRAKHHRGLYFFKFIYGVGFVIFVLREKKLFYTHKYTSGIIISGSDSGQYPSVTLGHPASGFERPHILIRRIYYVRLRSDVTQPNDNYRTA